MRPSDSLAEEVRVGAVCSVEMSYKSQKAVSTWGAMQENTGRQSGVGWGVKEREVGGCKMKLDSSCDLGAWWQPKATEDKGDS